MLGADWQTSGATTDDERLESSSDHLLLQSLQRGEQDAATELFRRYARRLRALARSNSNAKLALRVDADDIVQSVFRTFFRVAVKGAYEVPEGKDLWNLLAVIALNKIRTAATRHRAGKRDVRATIELDLLDAAKEAARAPQAEQAFVQLVVKEALARLTPAERRAIELRMENFEVAEIAIRCDCSKRTAERLIAQALSKLKRLFEEGMST